MIETPVHLETTVAVDRAALRAELEQQRDVVPFARDYEVRVSLVVRAEDTIEATRHVLDRIDRAAGRVITVDVDEVLA